MIMARAVPPGPPPLLVWHERAEIERLAARRAELARRIAMLRPHSHRRVELEARLRDVTARQLELESALDNNQWRAR